MEKGTKLNQTHFDRGLTGRVGLNVVEQLRRERERAVVRALAHDQIEHLLLVLRQRS